MKNTIICPVSIIIICITFSCTQLDIESEVETLLSNYNNKSPGAAVMIINDSEIILQKGYGLAELENSVPVTASSNFRLASITKQFTAMSIMILHEKGQLKYHNNLHYIFDDFPEYGSTITIRHLLQHTSGLIDYESLIPDTATKQVYDKDVLKMMMQVDSTYFPPGSKFQYSNSGYAVLAMIVEKISGISFPEFLKKNIFIPLKMTNSVAYVKGVNTIPNRAFGYAEDNGKFAFSDQSLTSAVLGDGGIYTSLEDMYKWDQELYSPTLVSSKTLGEAFTRGRLNSGEAIDYGYGWRRDYYKGIDRVYHPGSTCGFRNIYHRYPEKNISIIILSNRREAGVQEIANRIADLLLD